MENSCNVMLILLRKYKSILCGKLFLLVNYSLSNVIVAIAFRAILT